MGSQVINKIPESIAPSGWKELRFLIEFRVKGIRFALKEENACHIALC